MKSRPNLSIGDVSKATGITVFTLRQWERRFGYPVSEKRESGHRRYTVEETARLKLVARALNLGCKASKVVPLNEFELRKTIEKLDKDSQIGKLVSKSWLGLVRDWNETKLTEVFENDWNQLGPVGFVTQRLAPFLSYLGNNWQEGNLSIAHEHFFSNLAESFLSSKWSSMNRNNTGRPVILASLEGEEHGFGLHMCAVTLCSSNIRVLFLGNPTPLKDLTQMIHQNPAVGVCLSFSEFYPFKKAKDSIQKLLKELPKETTLFVGGKGAPSKIDGAHFFSDFVSFSDWLQYQWKPNAQEAVK